MSVLFEPVVITGGNGAVGKEIVDEFKKRSISYYHFSDLRNNGLTEIGSVMHLAARTEPIEEIINANILFLNNVISFALKNSVKTFIFFSTARVYGDVDLEDVTEDTALKIMNDCYGISKLMGESMLFNNGLQTICLRLPAILTRKKKDHFLWNLLDKLIQNEGITVTNYFKIFNNFIDVPSLIDFLSVCPLNKNFEIYNLACKKVMTLFEIVEYIKQAVNSKSDIIPSDIKRNFFNISTSKAERDGFIPPLPKMIIDYWLGLVL